MAEKLVETGWAYPCFCTEEELIAKREQVMAYLCRPAPNLSLKFLIIFPTLVSTTCHVADMVIIGVVLCRNNFPVTRRGVGTKRLCLIAPVFLSDRFLCR